jgi:hypothetical protein
MNLSYSHLTITSQLSSYLMPIGRIVMMNFYGCGSKHLWPFTNTSPHLMVYFGFFAPCSVLGFFSMFRSNLLPPHSWRLNMVQAEVGCKFHCITDKFSSCKSCKVSKVFPITGHEGPEGE